ncbi:MAG TPA: zinc ribbon domain-containing protein [Phototrophicaceae bacterium]|nr:zinc ribbon domain-containing protein [Phototrophicaceae bacterium]
MTKKTLGYVELEWTCPNCATNNPGLQKTCKNCGSPQPENVQFHAATAQPELLKDEQKIAQAQKGADFHCPYCGTRNPADATTCSQCGGDLTGAKQRASGMVVGAPPNPAQGSAVAASKIPQPVKAMPKFPLWILLPIGALLMICCVAAGFLIFHTDAVKGTVQSVSWQRSIPIEELHDVILEDWKDQVPSGVQTISCEQKQRSTDHRVVGSKEVCTQEMVDQGNGSAKLEEECHNEDQYEDYPVYDDYCKYPGQKWEQIDTLSSQGNDLNPYWPAMTLGSNQREGQRSSSYNILFDTSKGIKKYKTDDETLFGQCQIGSTWTLNINTFGTVTSIQP